MKTADESGEDEDLGPSSQITYGPIVASEPGWIPRLCNTSYRTTQLLFTNKNGRMVTCLRQPRDLYALSKSVSQSHLRWPKELQVLPQRPYHILHNPSEREPLHMTDKDFQPPHRAPDIAGKVVYDNSPDPEVLYFSSSKSTGKMTSLCPYYKLQGENDKTLIFESRFECGNLMRAIKVGENDYQLWVKFDLYTKRYTQWYYFRVGNARPNVNYRFTIMNFMKSGSLYNEGMKPLMYSEKDATEKNIGWVRVGSDIKYYRNDIRVEDTKDRYYHSLHWTCAFQNENDTYYFAHSYPYTYSDLQEYLRFLATDQRRKKCCKQRVLCQTLAGNHIYVLTVTAPTKCPKEVKLKKAIVITARIHPGETVGSWMMKGLLDYLTSCEPDAKLLRENFVFKIIPMLNPDGVIVGNYRCSMSGRDLNRNYKTVLKNSFPPVWATKYLIKRLQEEREVVLYCDFHGHSRKKNVFLYGCEKKNEKKNKLHARVFPMMLSKNAQDLVSFRGCRFSVSKHKEGTGRIVMWNLGIRYSYTLEASFFGSSMAVPISKQFHFTIQDYESIGYHFCDTLLDLFDPDTTKFDKILQELSFRYQASILKKRLLEGEISESDIKEEVKEYFCEIESESSCGSDSSMSDGLPMQLLHGSIPEITRTKRMKSKKERNVTKVKKQGFSPKLREKTITSTSNALVPDAVSSKSFKSSNVKQSDRNRFSYTIRHKKETPATNSVSPVHIGKTDKYFENLTYSFVQASLFPEDKKDSSGSIVKFQSNTSCDRCNPQYYVSQEEHKNMKEKSKSYTWYEVQIPNMTFNSEYSHDLNRDVLHNGKIPPRINKMFSLWAGEIQRREQLLRRRTVDQGDNAEYLRQKLANISSKHKALQGAHSGENLFDLKQKFSHVLSSEKGVSHHLKSADPKYLPLLRRKKNSFPMDSSEERT